MTMSNHVWNRKTIHNPYDRREMGNLRRLFFAATAVASLGLGCSSSNNAGTPQGGGSQATGGQATGGISTGGVVPQSSTGGSVSTGGSAVSTGGSPVSTGGAAVSTGGSAVSTGGAIPTGGSA
ncbi:MAG TPA: hypothetical protein VJ860_01680, partial [Polyangia bacterium]|nr:hypothetical protein [Polyangia bacterium]